MIKKIIAIGITWTFLFSSLTVLTTTGIDTVTTSQNNDIITLDENVEYEKPEFWGVLVGSNPFPEQDGDRFIIPTINLKNVLCDGGWKEDHIKLLTGQVNKREIFSALSWLEKNARPIDTVLIYLHDHGLENNFMVSSDLFGYSRLWYSQLDRRLDRIDCAGMAIIISACQSGTAMEKLRGYKRIIITSSDIDTHSGFNDRLIKHALSGYADMHRDIGNQDGYVSVEELYEYYIEEDYRNPDYPGYPRLQDEYEGQLSLTFHKWLEYYDYFPVHPSKFDRGDYIGDNGKRCIAQSFIPNCKNLTKVKICVCNESFDKTYPITVTIRKELKGNNLTSCTILPSNLGDGESIYLTFNFSDFNVTPGKKYYIVCSSSGEGYFHYWIYGNKDYCGEGNLYTTTDGSENWSAEIYSDLWFITYGEDFENKNYSPYNTLRPFGPTKGQKNKDYNFSVTTDDYEKDNIYYKFDWDDGNYSKWLGPYRPGEICTESHNWTKKGSYHVRVMVSDDSTSYYNWGEYSDTLRIDIARSKIDLKLEEFFDDYRIFYDIVDELFGWNIGH